MPLLLAPGSASICSVVRLEMPAESKEKETEMQSNMDHVYCLSVIVGNLRSLPKKMEEPRALTRLQRKYGGCSINQLTEDSLLILDSFQLMTADRRAKEREREEMTHSKGNIHGPQAGVAT